MIDIDEFTEMADEITNSLPEEFFRQLNGGVLVLEYEKLHQDSVPTAPLYVMGEYTNSRMMGKYISIYYGSFVKGWGYLSREALREQLRKTIVHEFRHHLEALSGRRELEMEDAVRLADYKNRYGVKEEE